MLKQALLAITFFFFLLNGISAQQADTLLLVRNDSAVLRNDSTVSRNDSLTAGDSIRLQMSKAASTTDDLTKLLQNNIFLNSRGKPFTIIPGDRIRESKDSLFYSILLILFLFGLLRLVYSRYLINLFRVFFNTSLRQSQLVDQVIQAKLPSLLFNAFFFIISGWYVYLLFSHFGRLDHYARWQILLMGSLGLLLVYLFKFAVLKFTGWITGFQQEAETYIFIVFLINKIVGVCLIPVVILMAFSDKFLIDFAVLFSFVLIGIMLLMRFFRSYGLLQDRLKVSGFHFFIYIIGVEIIPLFVIYKVALLFMSKSL